MFRRSMFFVPGNDERSIRKSCMLNPDSVILDLEDLVPTGEKERARDLLERLLRELDWGGKEICVRINSIYTKEGLEDLVSVARWDKVSLVMIPKAENDLGFIYKATGKNFIPLVETSRGVLRIEDIARSEGVVAIAWGHADLSLSVEGSFEAYENNLFLFIKSLVSITASSYGIRAIDKVYLKEDLEGFKREALEAKNLATREKWSYTQSI